MNICTISLHVIVIIMAILRLLENPLFNMSIGFGGGLTFNWKSFWWFLFGFAAFINLLMDII